MCKKASELGKRDEASSGRKESANGVFKTIMCTYERIAENRWNYNLKYHNIKEWSFGRAPLFA
jgi:hypothetical protein